MKYTAKSASRDDAWPYWMIVDSHGVNVSARLVPVLRGHMPFLPRKLAEFVAGMANEAPGFIYKPRIRLTNAMIEKMKEKQK